MSDSDILRNSILLCFLLLLLDALPNQVFSCDCETNVKYVAVTREARAAEGTGEGAWGTLADGRAGHRGTPGTQGPHQAPKPAVRNT